MQDLNDLNLFVAVVTHGGISAAARALGAPKSRISRRVAGLEGQLGVRLFERSTRRFKVTDVGRDVFRHARAALSEAEAIREIALQRKAEPQGLVRVITPPGVDRLISRSLPQLLARHPKLRVQVVVSNREVDLIDDQVDVAVRVREVLDTDGDLQMKIVSRVAGLLVANPRLLDRCGVPAAPADLAWLPTLSVTDLPGPDRWILESAAEGEVEVAHEPRLSSSSLSVVRQAAADGLGVAVIPEWLCREFLETGQLVRILPEWTRRQGILHIVFTSRRGLLPGVRAVLDFLSQALKPDASAWAAAL